VAYTERLAAADVLPSVGSVGDAYDNALTETTIGLFKTELFKPRGPWRTIDQVEIAVLEWVDWYDHWRLHEYCGDIPTAEREISHYRQHTDLAEARSSTN
jgi:putative transposase